jgi:hypothetical protein
LKNLFIYFLCFFALAGNAFGENEPNYNSLILNPIEKANQEIENTRVKFSNPLEQVDMNLASFEHLLSVFNDFKKFDIPFVKGLLEKVKSEETLSGSELFALRRTITVYYKINKKILDFARVYDLGEFKMSKTFSDEEHNIPMIKAHLIWLTGHLVVLDHLESMHHLIYENDGVFRRIVKSALKDKSDTTEGESKTINDLIKVNKYTVDIGESLKFTQQINLVRAISTDLKDLLKDDENNTSTLIDTIIDNPTSNKMAQGKINFTISHFFLVDAVVNIYDTVTSWLSKIFGNLAGSIRTRNGYLYNNNLLVQSLKKQLRPMDILLEKSPFTLTDKFIPGHFGHAAVYLGSKEQLIEIGMWNHPDILPFQEEISKGKVILEAVRTGVHLNTLEDFLNIDEFTLIRKEDALSNISLLIEQITRGMDQIGKSYDFNFDITTLDKIVCSELVYIVFGNTNWPTKYRVGRATITPDDVAEILFQKNTKYHIKNFLVSKSEDKVESVGIDYIADDLEFELRTSSGDPISNREDQSNSYWKRITKCYTVEDSSQYGNDSNNARKRTCNTTYKEYYYEERENI